MQATDGGNAHLLKERVLTLKDVTNHVPTRPCFTTVWRWVTAGIHGIRLETYRIGKQRITSQEAVGRFLAAMQAEVAE